MSIKNVDIEYKRELEYEELVERIMCKDIYLRRGEECIGFYEGLEVSEFAVVVILSCNGARVRLKFPANMTKMDTLKRQLGSYKSGTKIGLLRTYEAFRPIIIRAITT